MKKYFLILSVLTGIANAQVTISGKLDQGVGKRIGSSDKEVMDGTLSGSRLTFRGIEVIDEDLSAVFGFEHRLFPDTGNAASPPNPPGTFWGGYSWVGLKSNKLGTVTLGRHFNASYLLAQGQFDPFANETVGSLRAVGIAPAVATTKTSNDIKYDYTRGDFNFGANVGEAVGGPNKPYTLGMNYKKDKFFVALGYENPSSRKDYLMTVGARYDHGKTNLRVATSFGKTVLDQSVRSYLVGAVVTMDPKNSIKVGWAQGKVDTVTTQKIAIGYQHNLSKRTFLYTDLARQLKPHTVERTGYDLGIQHTF